MDPRRMRSAFRPSATAASPGGPRQDYGALEHPHMFDEVAARHAAGGRSPRHGSRLISAARAHSSNSAAGSPPSTSNGRRARTLPSTPGRPPPGEFNAALCRCRRAARSCAFGVRGRCHRTPHTAGGRGVDTTPALASMLLLFWRTVGEPARGAGGYIIRPPESRFCVWLRRAPRLVCMCVSAGNVHTSPKYTNPVYKMHQTVPPPQTYPPCSPPPHGWAGSPAHGTPADQATDVPATLYI